MVKLTKDIALTRTPTTRIICIPAKAIQDMGIENEKYVRAVYDFDTKTLTIKKINGDE